MSRAPTRISPWRKALFAAGVTALVLGGSELGLRAAGWGPAYRPDFAGWRMPDNLRDHVMDPPSEPHRFTVNTDAAGLRTTLPEARTPGVPRIAILGDSTVFGWGVDDGADLPTRLQTHLRARTGAPIEVLNAAQPGYTTAQLVALFADAVDRHAPDLVVLVVPQHDRTPALVSDWEHIEGIGGPAAWLRVMLARHSRIYHLLWTRLGEVPGPATASGEMLSSPGVVRVPRVSDDERDEAADQLRAGAAAWGGRVALALIPYYPDLQHAPGEPGGDGPHVPWHRDYAASRGVPLIDARHCCGPDADAMVFPFDQWHYNERGNDAVAQALATGLLDADLVPLSR